MAYREFGTRVVKTLRTSVVERLRLFDADTLLYQFDIDNPTAFTQPWKGELTMTRSGEMIYEYACHEANYSLTNMLRGFRAAERPVDLRKR